MRKFFNDEAGFVVSAELVLVLTIAVLGVATMIVVNSVMSGFGMRRQIAAENWLASEMITLDELIWFRLDFRTPAVDTTIRNITLGTSLENRMLLVSFNTATAEEEVWLPIGQQMIQSLRLSR